MTTPREPLVLISFPSDDIFQQKDFIAFGAYACHTGELRAGGVEGADDAEACPDGLGVEAGALPAVRIGPVISEAAKGDPRRRARLADGGSEGIDIFSWQCS